MQQLPAIVRVLLLTDGTVTRSLQAYFSEEIEVRVMQQSPIVLDEHDHILDCQTGEQVWRRRVQLIGVTSMRIYACAETHLNAQRLPTSLSEGLAKGDFGVGELLQMRGLETFREVLSHGTCQAIPEVFGFASEGGSAWRHYLIRHQGQVLMHIREYFPLASYVQ